MVISAFEWDDGNVFRIERHQFALEEVEEVFSGDYKVTREGLYISLGETLGGRLAFGGVSQAVQARDMEGSERRMFRRKHVDMMKTKIPAAKAPLPRFRSDHEAAEYFETHSVAEVWNQLPEGKPAAPSKALAKAIHGRHTAAKSPISIRLGSEQIAAAKRIAAAKSVGYQTQLRMWIAEGIRREAKPRGRSL